MDDAIRERAFEENEVPGLQGAVVSGYIQCLLGDRMDAEREAGGIVVRLENDSSAFLIVRSSDRKHWVLPKGHVEPHESAEEAAVREVAEEAGITTTPIAFVGRTTFTHDARRFSVEYYLLRYAASTGAGERREARWCTYDEALELLSFDETKQALKQALSLLTRGVRL